MDGCVDTENLPDYSDNIHQTVEDYSIIPKKYYYVANCPSDSVSGDKIHEHESAVSLEPDAMELVELLRKLRLDICHKNPANMLPMAVPQARSTSDHWHTFVVSFGRNAPNNGGIMLYLIETTSYDTALKRNSSTSSDDSVDMNPEEDAHTSLILKGIIQTAFSGANVSQENSKNNSNKKVWVMAVKSFDKIGEDQFKRGRDEHLTRFFSQEQFNDDEDTVRKSLHLIFLEIDDAMKREKARSIVEEHIKEATKAKPGFA